MYRIHGSNEPETIGQAVSSGCIRMRNEDVIDLYERVKVGTKVVVLCSAHCGTRSPMRNTCASMSASSARRSKPTRNVRSMC